MNVTVGINRIFFRGEEGGNVLYLKDEVLFSFLLSSANG